MKNPIRNLTIAVATTGLLIVAGPASADRDDYSGYRDRPNHKTSHAIGPAYRDGGKRDDNPGKGHAYGKDKHRGDGKQHGKGKDNYARREQGDLNDRHERSDRQDQSGRRDRHERSDRQDQSGRRDRHERSDRHDQSGHRDRHERSDRRDRYDRYDRHDGYSRYDGHRRERNYVTTKHRHRHKHHWRPSHYHYGYRWKYLPRNFIRITVGALGLYYSDGIFYRPHEHGYVVTEAPIGAVVYSLPGSAVRLEFGGRHYYAVYDTYYLWDGPGRGYRVVANPGFY